MFSNYNIDEFFKILETIRYRSHPNFRILKKTFVSEITIYYYHLLISIIYHYVFFSTLLINCFEICLKSKFCFVKLYTK